MKPVSSLYDHSSVKPPPATNTSADNFEEVSQSDEDNINANFFTKSHNIAQNYDTDLIYNPKFIDLDGTYDQNIKILLTFSYVNKPEKMTNYSKNNGYEPLIKDSVLNSFKSLDVCAVARGLNRELFSCLTFCSKCKCTA